jgi:hypothetical protein
LLSVAGGLLAISRSLGSACGGPRVVRRRALSVTGRSKDDLSTGGRAPGSQAGSQASDLRVMPVRLAVARFGRPTALATGRWAQGRVGREPSGRQLRRT